MTDAERREHASKAMGAWQEFCSHMQVLFPERFDEMRELVPEDIVALIGLIRELTGMP